MSKEPGVVPQELETPLEQGGHNAQTDQAPKFPQGTEAALAAAEFLEGEEAEVAESCLHEGDSVDFAAAAPAESVIASGDSAKNPEAPHAQDEESYVDWGALEHDYEGAVEPPASTGDIASEKSSEESSALTRADAAFAKTQEDKPAADAGGHEMTFTEHLQELRLRLTRCLIAVCVGFFACYGFAEELFLKLMEPLTNLLLPSGGSLIYTGLPEAFFTHMKVAAIAGLFLVSPYIFYQLWMFVAPGLYEGERKWMIPIAICSAMCFVMGALFGYYVVFPFGFQFFLGYATDLIRPMPSVKEYFSLATTMLFAFGLIFELPLFMLFLSMLGLVTYKSLQKYRKYAILGNFIVAAILTPTPDVINQLLMAGPLCILYEVGIVVAFLFGKKPKDADAEPPKETPAAA